ncbi:DUF4124 domain-containing protein [Thauera linaloolentis]|uniref:DUF4124 domain-containing protein n=1 Tax=Thauera linaloolentis (strain DSM 12138 / JCM 21573 / CCUG 41526 / CIP 105981 / IAM 15112 / NBRC 102519 / 47Lol) TaxID=1123367 RepID=N6YZ32_THAL4|nr:DUF4124 domain-containing protein [Thauera linaloolentis]ENO87652.1 hypothetical protein C666_10520 [Thauera linaloolentis 47Lol = DSM 12138]MCM8565980.1 DUF4124 domain-containing protein [Thauera linaloolentis]
MIRPAVLLLALMASFPVAAQIYSWKDKDGRIHYSDVPPPTGEVKTLRGAQPPAPPAPPAQAGDEAAGGDAGQEGEQPVDAETAFRQRRAAEAEAAAKAAQGQADEAERQRFCSDARSQLAALESGQRIARMNAAGERELLNDDARAAESNRLQRQIDANCN